jgi:threonylcarbamoyladenosine tRNA methylthiotransferase MtaB
VENFGCRATQADGAALERQFEQRGLVRASTPAQASVVVLNTCTVTAAADRDARAAIRRVRRQNPDASIVVTGCYAQRAPEEIAALPGVSLVVGNSHKHKLAEIVVAADFGWRSGSSAAMEPPSLSRALAPGGLAFVPLTTLTGPSGSRTPEAGSPIFISDIFAHTELLAAPVFDAANDCHESERTRPNLKVQDGCDNRCSFCVIPYVRGQSRSLEMERIIRDVNGLVESGYREVVISGINLGRWGRDLDVRPQTSDLSQTVTSDVRGPKSEVVFEGLIRAILSETALEKLRISSVEPMDWSNEIISLVASSARIAKHAHVPLQSGSDAVLRRMHRKYRPWHYREKIEKIRASMPTAAIGADVMVGFPGETDAEFESTRQMIEDLPFTYLHVFTYSARPGTPAASMAKQVPVHVARERNRVLRELAAEKKLEFMRGFVGKELDAITLNVIGSDESGEFTEALTDNYLKLRLRGRQEANQWLRAQVDDVIDGVLVGISAGATPALTLPPSRRSA